MLNFATRHTARTNRPATRTPTVFVVDPQSEGYDDWHSLAQANGVRLEVLASAEDALRLARTATIDLWVINTRLPGISGCELCDMLKARDSRTAVYLVADDYTPDIEQMAWQSRATLFGCKPAQRAWLTQWLDLRPNDRANDAAASQPTSV